MTDELGRGEGRGRSSSIRQLGRRIKGEGVVGTGGRASREKSEESPSLRPSRLGYLTKSCSQASFEPKTRLRRPSCARTAAAETSSKTIMFRTSLVHLSNFGFRAIESSLFPTPSSSIATPSPNLTSYSSSHSSPLPLPHHPSSSSLPSSPHHHPQDIPPPTSPS